VELVLDRCPHQAPASAAPDIICQLHFGLVEGIGEAAGDGLEVTGLIARDPRQARCRLKLSRVVDAGATEESQRR
jgi:hypothetical protein